MAATAPIDPFLEALYRERDSLLRRLNDIRSAIASYEQPSPRARQRRKADPLLKPKSRRNISPEGLAKLRQCAATARAARMAKRAAGKAISQTNRGIIRLPAVRTRGAT